MEYILYGVEASYYTGKARAYLRWKNIPYKEIPSDMNIYASEIVPRVGFPVIPVVVTPENETLQDTTVIIDALEEKHAGPSIYPTGARQKFLSLALELYGDDWLLLPAMHYRWAYNRDFAIAEFGKNSRPDLPEAEQIELGAKLAERFSGFCLPLGINEQTIPAIEKSYEQLLRDLDTHFREHDYLFGGRPSIGDYGLIGPLYAHLYRDPESQKVMEQHGPNVVQWVKRMMSPPAPLKGNFLECDEVPETLMPIISRMMAEQLPVLSSTVRAVSAWCESNEEEQIPRAIGFHDFTVEGVTSQRMISPYTQWMLQRVLDFYQSLPREEQAEVDTLLQECGGEMLTKIKIDDRLEIVDFRLQRS